MNVITNDQLRCTIALAVLQDVMDPEIGLSVVDLGLIYQIDFEEANRQLYVSMTLTTQFCPMGASIVAAVKRAMENTFTHYTVIVTLTFTPPWNNERISEAGSAFLNQ